MRPRRADTSEPACTNRKMLSTKSSTSWPPSSRKYSAIVRPDRATRRRAPGGSFIWPYTSAVLSMTPLSFISSQRSLPSRVRSPTPANTERPPCSWAMLWISSWISTVLPTPAPPKRPILPPFTYGARRSTTLMPVSKISSVGLSWSNAGRVPVDRPALAGGDVGALVDGVAQHVEDAPERPVADGDRDRAARVASPWCRGRGRPWCRRPPRARGRRPGAAGPRRSAGPRRRRGRSRSRCRCSAAPRPGSGRR